MTTSELGVVVSTFLAAGVEFVEAFTIVLAMGVTRGWRSALAGVAAASVALAAITAVGGYALVQWVPETALQLVVGFLLLVFGLQWLRKAILRTAGLKALHDEDAAYRQEVAAADRAGRRAGVAGVDPFAFVVAFKGVLLEGLEIVFIVITFGTNADAVGLAAAGAAAGGVLVVGAGAAAARPLSRVPENALKFAVGLALCSFGTFWSVEGLGTFREGSDGLRWPGGELSLAVVLAAWVVLSWITVRILAHHPRAPQRAAA